MSKIISVLFFIVGVASIYISGTIEGEKVGLNYRNKGIRFWIVGIILLVIHNIIIRG